MDSVHTPRAWMRLPSGKRLDLINPDPHGWLDSDLAVRLARTYRWGGESCWPLSLSVAQHSLLVLEIRRNLTAAPLSPMVQMQELLHDAEEAFLGFDCISPLKQMLGEPFKSVETRLSAAIWHRYKLDDWTDQQFLLHKQADAIAAASEAVHCVGWSPDEVKSVLEISAPVFDNDPLHTRYGDIPWKPWPAAVAAARFLFELSDLSHQLSACDRDTSSVSYFVP